MKLPTIDPSTLPDLTDKLTGLFGSLGETAGHDDTIVILATYAFEVTPLTSSVF